MNLLVKFPSRSRPKRFAEVLREWVRLADNLDNIHFLFGFDDDDTSMDGAPQVIRELNINASIPAGISHTKVHAINRDINEFTKPWDVLVVVSDDMWPKVQGWDTMIAARAKDNPDHMIWYFDGRQRDICTLPVMDRAYYQRDSHVYDPRFTSVFCDDLATHLARQRNRLVYVEAVLAEHRHPANFSEVKKDALYLKNETQAIWDKDQALYEQLKEQLSL